MGGNQQRVEGMMSLLSSQFSSLSSRTTFLRVLSSSSTSWIRVAIPCRRFSRSMSTSVDALAAAGSEPVPDGGDLPKRQDLDVLVQYIVLRRDLIDTWPLGSIITQGCHASVASVWSHRDHPDTTGYCSVSNLDSMHKVTLEVKGEQQILNLSEKLNAGGISHKLWIEQPENIPTCIATRPYPKSEVASFFKKLKLSFLKMKKRTS